MSAQRNILLSCFICLISLFNWLWKLLPTFLNRIFFIININLFSKYSSSYTSGWQIFDLKLNIFFAEQCKFSNVCFWIFCLNNVLILPVFFYKKLYRFFIHLKIIKRMKLTVLYLNGSAYTPTSRWWWWWWWIVLVQWLTNERCLALFPGRTLVRDPHHCESPTQCKQAFEPAQNLS